MIVSTDALGNEVIFDPTKIVYATKLKGSIEIRFNIMGSEETTIILNIDEWDKVKGVLLNGKCCDVMERANSSKIENKENKTYNYYLGYTENGAMYVAHYIGFYDSDKKFPKDFDYKSGFVTPLTDIFCINPQLPAVFLLTTPFNRSLVGRSLRSGDMLDYNVTCVNGFYKEPDGSLMVDGQKII